MSSAYKGALNVLVTAYNEVDQRRKKLFFSELWTKRDSEETVIRYVHC